MVARPSTAGEEGRRERLSALTGGFVVEAIARFRSPDLRAYSELRGYARDDVYRDLLRRWRALPRGKDRANDGSQSR